MLRVSFSSSVDEPRLEHCRKSILSKVLWDEMLGSGRLDWAWIGDEEVSYENALSNPASIVAIDTEMMAEGKFVFSFRMVDHPTKFKVVIEKFEIRKRVVGRVFGYRAEISMPTIETAEKSYLVARSLPDLNQRLFGVFVNEERHEGLDEKVSITVMSSW